MSNPWKDIDKPGSDFNVRLVSEKHPLSLFWGRDTQGRYLFIYDVNAEHAPERKSILKLYGITLGVALDEDRAKLVMILNETANWELFYSLCTDLIRATFSVEEPATGTKVFLRRLTRWQEFLKRKRPDVLPPEAVKGLIGELLFLEERVVPAFGWETAVASWKGPEDAPQDFAIHETAVEIKCQSGGSQPKVRIASAEQLIPQLPDGYLVVYTISTADCDETEGFSLNGLVERIRDRLEDAHEATSERFEELLFLAGYTMREEYDETKYKRIAAKCFQIRDDFPRIQLSSIPAGIEHVSYSLKLEPCEPFEVCPSWWEGQR